MHNLKEIRKNLDYYKKKIKDRNVDVDFENLLNLDKINRDLILNKEKFEHEKKLLSKTKDEKNFQKSKRLTEDIADIEIKQKELQKKIRSIISIMPNIAMDDVPVGEDEKSNKQIKKLGEPKKFEFKIKSHVEIGENLKYLDFDSATKISGSRFVVLKDKFALLERALINFMLDIHTKMFNYKEISPPIIVNEETMFGTGQLPKFKNDQYELSTEKNEVKKYLIPTAEVSLTNLARDSIIDSKNLPLRYVASTPCFRKEAGSYGKDTKGMMRQHQFYKVELVSLVEPKDSINELKRMLSCAEEILKKLNLPYRIMLLSTGDMGFSAEKTYDIEVWIPSENKYREISSCSSCGTFQARRMSAKYKKQNKSEFLVTLNGSGLATGRLMISLIENYQNSDGSITIPENLRVYMNNLEKI